MPTYATAKVTNTQDVSSWGPIYAIVAKKGQTVLDAAKQAGQVVTRIYGYNTTPDHNNRRCIDFMHYGNTKLRYWLVNYLIKHAKDLGVQGIISNRKCMGFPSNETDNPTPYWNGPEGEWRDYHGPNPHTDHVHVQFNLAEIKTTKTKTVTRYTKQAGVTGYNNRGKARVHYPKGTKLVGVIDHGYAKRVGSYGDYLRVGKIPHRLWVPVSYLSTTKP